MKTRKTIIIIVCLPFLITDFALAKANKPNSIINLLKIILNRILVLKYGARFN